MRFSCAYIGYLRKLFLLFSNIVVYHRFHVWPQIKDVRQKQNILCLSPPPVSTTTNNTNYAKRLYFHFRVFYFFISIIDVNSINVVFDPRHPDQLPFTAVWCVSWLSLLCAAALAVFKTLCLGQTNWPVSCFRHMMLYEPIIAIMLSPRYVAMVVIPLRKHHCLQWHKAAFLYSLWFHYIWL